jgi:uncharacterized protein (TIGR02453 family)
VPAHFTPELFGFLDQLAAHNDRDWFQKNKSSYIEHIQEPALQFIADFAPHLAKISSHFTADARPVGGSLFRIYRDTRFSKDKTPYKTHVAMVFRHQNPVGPGFYLHLEPAACYMGVGIWRPETPVATQIRGAIASDPAGWKQAAHGPAFLARFNLEGDSLTRPPKGFDPAHPMIDDLKRKDFTAGTRLSDEQVTASSFIAEFAGMCKTASPFVRFLTQAVGAPF